MLSTGFSFLVLCSALLPAIAQNVPTYDFLSRPDISAPILQVRSINYELVSDGLIFLTPSTPAAADFSFGMHIYNNNGSLVWSGSNFNPEGHQIVDFYPCDNFRSAPHLCVTMFQGPVGGGEARDSYSLILDDTYQPVLTASPDYVWNGAKITQDLHEFNVVGTTGGSAMMSSYVTTNFNATLPGCPSNSQVSWVKNCLFTETSLDGTNTTIFAWSAVDHVPISDSYLCPCDNPSTGCGTSESDPFDWFHINAIDKDVDGDYLVSSRHLWTLFKIAGLKSPSGLAPGTIIWRLGGKQNSFDHMETIVPNSGNFNFSYQHHARWREGGLHFWDNANDAITQASAHSSSGMGVDINFENRTATLVSQSVPPDGSLDSSQGSHQILPNGNHFCGVGSVPEVFERTANNVAVFDAYFGVEPMQSYRAFRYPWTGHPANNELSLFIYAHNCGAHNAYHVSWNGATEVASYRFYVANATNAAFVETGSVLKDWRFENTGVGNSFGLYGYAVALDAQGSVMARSPTVKTFVPSSSLAASCNPIQCAQHLNYQTAPQSVCSASQSLVVTQPSNHTLPGSQTSHSVQPPAPSASSVHAPQ